MTTGFALTATTAGFGCAIEPTAGRFRIAELGEEGRAVGGHEIDDEAGGLVGPRLEHERLVDEEGAVHVDDDARLARREQPVAIAGDEAPLLGAETLGHLEARPQADRR